MNSVERVKAICKERRIPISKLERDLGYSNAYISQLRKGTFPDDRLKEIAQYLNVSIDYLMTGSEIEPNEAKLKPGVNIVKQNGDVQTFDFNSIIYSIMESVSEMPQEQQEMVNNMVGGNSRPQKTTYETTSQNKEPSTKKNSTNIIEGYFTNVEDALTYIQEEAGMVASFNGQIEKPEVIIQMANAMFMNRNKE